MPQPILDAIVGDPYDRGESTISVTALIDSPRLEALKEAHKDELSEEIADMANSLIGTAVHAYLAQRSTGELDDNKRLTMEVLGWVVSGQTDYYHDGIIYDWKVPSVSEAKFGLKKERIAQLNVYRVLLETNGYPVRGMKAVLITKNWSPYDINLAEHSIVTRDVEMWDYDEACEYILERVRLHQLAREELPECSPDERWMEADKFAVIKQGSARAVKNGLKDDEEEADALANELTESTGTPHLVEYRAGDPTTADRRCWAWHCVAYPVCEQGQQIHAGIGG